MVIHTGSVAEEARAAIARQRIRQSTIAEALNLSQASVSRRLSGDVDFTSTELRKLADLLGMPVGAFFGEVAA
jgi:transcriptional regulator with XRE-family HTH domain